MADKQQYFSILTDIGRFKIAKAAADKGEVKITHFAIGDGGGQETSPTPGQKALVHEVWRTQVESVNIDEKNPAAVIVSALIPRDVGGWWIREFGIFDEVGDMLAVVKPAPNYKATIAEGQNEDIIYQFQLIIGENANIVVVIDPSSQYLTREAADKVYPSREEVKTGYVSKDDFAAVGKGWVKHSELNAAINGVKVMNQPWLAVLALDLQAPPASPHLGDVYLVAAGGTGAWAGKDGQIAEWRGDTDKWRFTQPLNGHGIGLPNGDVYVRFNGSYQPFKYGRLDKENAWQEDNSFKKKISVLGEAVFASSVSMTALAAAGTATFNGPLLANGDVAFNGGGTRLSGKIAGNLPFHQIMVADQNKQGGGVKFVDTNGNALCEISYDVNRGVRIGVQGIGDVFSIQSDGNIKSKFGEQIFGAGMLLNNLKSYIDQSVGDAYWAGDWNYRGATIDTGDMGGRGTIQYVSGSNGYEQFRFTDLFIRLRNGEERKIGRR
ncbi:phage tail protein [Candidatus Tokpelaia sp.]|uniref:phage tail-collar fiber domain-containing protein n=1 Tax=Candidatus Tokpelaia sp. TaxID=2233777 RepID=UPI00123B329D|nr:phage tail protein [Candidatus Tokpelaia sp.]KAA6404504.1 hypothetical protein DPQ22_09745 [Candidatus Tokpelaia sp.]